MILKRFMLGGIPTNCYIFGSNKTKEVVIIDVGGDPQMVFDEIEKKSLKPIAVLLTHGHGDHTIGLRRFLKRYKVPLLYHKSDREIMRRREANRYLVEGDEIKVGEFTLKVLETPGHSPGSVVYYTKEAKEYKDSPIDGVIFSGDLICRRSIGKSDSLEGGDREKIKNSLRYKIMRNEIFTDNFIIFSGHTTKTTIGQERDWNLFKHYF